jgi:hypothetical protein
LIAACLLENRRTSRRHSPCRGHHLPACSLRGDPPREDSPIFAALVPKKFGSYRVVAAISIGERCCRRSHRFQGILRFFSARFNEKPNRLSIVPMV